jgi:hypothetical protein
MSKSEGVFLVSMIKLGGSFGIILEGDCQELEATSTLELLVTFGMS